MRDKVTWKVEKKSGWPQSVILTFDVHRWDLYAKHGPNVVNIYVNFKSLHAQEVSSRPTDMMISMYSRTSNVDVK